MGRRMDETQRSEAFEQVAREQRRAWLATTPEQRIAWLEQAKRFAAQALEAARERHRKPRPPDLTDR